MPIERRSSTSRARSPETSFGVLAITFVSSSSNSLSTASKARK